MIIYDPCESLVRQLIEMRKAQLYRCVVDGEDTFRGERLPIGTRDQILAWLNDRYRVVDELRLGSPDRIIVYSYLTWIRRPPPLRYLVIERCACQPNGFRARAGLERGMLNYLHVSV